jgi:DnaK suppressor protein
VSKLPAKAAGAGKTAAKTAAAAPAKPAPHAKSAKAAPTAKATAPAARSAAPAAKTAASRPAAAKTPAPAPRPARAETSAAGKPPAKPVAAPPPEAPVVNRFTDRFAPAQPASRVISETFALPKTAHKIDPKLANAWKNKAGRDLSDEELLAMPESEYMSEKQLDFFRARLQQQKDDLLSNAGETTEHLREDTSIVPDPADRATIEEEHALELRTRDRERKLLKKIAQSLARLDSGDYGYCDETGEPIGLARLIARPTATLSLEAQQRRELKQKMFGD